MYNLSNLPAHPRRFATHLRSERKYFDSGDYALSKAGRGDGVDLGAVGSEHPAPERIPHPNPHALGGMGMGMNLTGPGMGVDACAGHGEGRRRRSGLGVEGFVEDE